MPLIYKKGDVLSDKQADVFCHACNCQHVWGAGVAKQFKEKFPWAFECEEFLHRAGLLHLGEAEYYQPCEESEPNESGPDVVCLYTSSGYGKNKDSVDDIVLNTSKALAYCATWFDRGIIIASPKINSGLFGVPWERTAELIEAFVTLTGVEWRVYEQHRERHQ